MLTEEHVYLLASGIVREVEAVTRIRGALGRRAREVLGRDARWLLAALGSGVSPEEALSAWRAWVLQGESGGDPRARATGENLMLEYFDRKHAQLPSSLAISVADIDRVLAVARTWLAARACLGPGYAPLTRRGLSAVW